MQIYEINTADLVPYEKNPRRNENAVNAVAESIKEFGFKVPIVIDRDNVIVAGHTRLKAAKKLGMSSVPCVIADDLTPAQIKAFRLADNKSAELATWDLNLLGEELADITDIDMSLFAFDPEKLQADNAWFDDREKDDTSRQEGNEEYNEFLDKFEPKKTTDDCYTPPIVYDAIVEWVEKEYGANRSTFFRPFYPGGDYASEKYPEGCIVVDNPPFSILAEIVRFYSDRGIRFFLFAPSLTIFSSSSSSSCAIVCGAGITYENGAVVATSFLTNMEDGLRFRSAPDLYEKIKDANEENLKAKKTELPKYSYPDHVVTAASLQYLSKHGVEFSAKLSETERISALDAQKEYGKAIFGNGYLLSERAAAERAAAERAAAERAAAERAAAERAAAHRWELSEREWSIVKRLSAE